MISEHCPNRIGITVRLAPEYAHIATQGGYLQSFTNISGNIVNFFNTNDFALAKGTYGGLQANWEENQRAQKPESLTGDNGYNNSWRFNGTNSYRMELAVLVTITNLVTDSQEIRSMLARSRSRAVGAQNNVGGIIGNQIDLGARFGFGDSRSEHSAQFTRPLQSVWGYYDELILGFGMQLNVTR